MGTTGGTLRLVRCWFYCRVCVLHRGWRWWKERSYLAWGEPKFSLKADEGSDYALDPLNNQNGLYYNTKLYSPWNSLHIILNCLPQLTYYTICKINLSVHWRVRITQQLYLVVVLVVDEPCQQASDKKEVLINLIPKTNASQAIEVSTQQRGDVRNAVVVWVQQSYMLPPAQAKDSPIHLFSTM